MKDNFLCPFCEKGIMKEYNSNLLTCSNCNSNLQFDIEQGIFFDPIDNKVLDIMYKSTESSVLSNLFPNSFIINNLYNCASIEGFLRSLTIKSDTIAIKQLCDLHGINAYKVRSVLPDWRETQTLYFNGKEFKRSDNMYNEVISLAYDSLFEQNHIFRMALSKYKDKIFIHSIGCNNPSETLLTQHEYLSQLNRLKNLL